MKFLEGFSRQNIITNSGKSSKREREVSTKIKIVYNSKGRLILDFQAIYIINIKGKLANYLNAPIKSCEAKVLTLGGHTTILGNCTSDIRPVSVVVKIGLFAQSMNASLVSQAANIQELATTNIQ